MITGVTSLAGYCYLLKKENRKLASERTVQSTEVVQTVVNVPRVSSSTQAETVPEDIRNFAAGRRSRWVKNLASSIPR
jgi:hypothetical protein